MNQGGHQNRMADALVTQGNGILEREEVQDLRRRRRTIQAEAPAHSTTVAVG